MRFMFQINVFFFKLCNEIRNLIRNAKSATNGEASLFLYFFLVWNLSVLNRKGGGYKAVFQ